MNFLAFFLGLAVVAYLTIGYCISREAAEHSIEEVERDSLDESSSLLFSIYRQVGPRIFWMAFFVFLTLFWLPMMVVGGGDD